jgi:hypothetical protein
MNYKDVLKSNKKVTEADRKFVDAVITPRINEDADQAGLVNVLTSFIYNMQSGYGMMGFSERTCKKYGFSKGKAQQYFDRARYLVSKLDSDAYMRFID